MGQVTLYFDKTTEAQVRKAAQEAGVSLSKWVSSLVKEKLVDQWPQSIVDLAGSWSEFPTTEETLSNGGSDIPREQL